MISKEERDNLENIYLQSFNTIIAIRSEYKTVEERMDSFFAMLNGVTHTERVAITSAFMGFAAAVPPVEPDKEETE